jgi:hypothetical protein
MTRPDSFYGRDWRGAFGHIALILLLALGCGAACTIAVLLDFGGWVFPVFDIGQNWNMDTAVRLCLGISLGFWFVAVWCCKKGPARTGRAKISFAVSEFTGAVLNIAFAFAFIVAATRLIEVVRR